MEPFEREIRARTDNVGRAATDPRVLLCLWLYAISEGIGSARHLARLCERDDPYRWIAGGLTPNHHTLSSFRIAHGEALDELLTKLLAGLMCSGVVSLQRTSQDGVRVRANASAGSFRREPSLRKALRKARRQVAKSKADLDAPARDESQRKLAARQRAARDREERVKKALEAVDSLRQGSQKDKDPEQVRASTTDAEARVMRMADGGYRPAVNVQLAVDTQSRFIVDVAVTNSGSDLNQLNDGLDRIEQRTGRLPEEHLADGGYSKKQQIEEAARRGVKVYSPPTKSPKGGAAPPRWDDGPGVSEWRERMQTESAQEVYKQRAATAETVFADWRQWRGLKQMPVRGVAKATCVALLVSLTYNFIRMVELGIGAVG
jgi:transposase